MCQLLQSFLCKSIILLSYQNTSSLVLLRSNKEYHILYVMNHSLLISTSPFTVIIVNWIAFLVNLCYTTLNNHYMLEWQQLFIDILLECQITISHHKNFILLQDISMLGKAKYYSYCLKRGKHSVSCFPDFLPKDSGNFFLLVHFWILRPQGF